MSLYAPIVSLKYSDSYTLLLMTHDTEALRIAEQIRGKVNDTDIDERR